MTNTREARTVRRTAVPVTGSVARTSRDRLMPMIRMDFYRLFHTPVFYVMVAISAIIPALVVTMVPANEDPAVAATPTYTNAWQVVESVSGTADNAALMDLATMCNINMVYIFAALLVSIFIAHDYSSGFVKSIFTTHATKTDYAVSKTLICWFSGCCMVLAYVLAALIVGGVSGLSLSLGDLGASVFGALCCVLGKMLLMGLFTGLYVTVAVFFRSRLWLSILAAFCLGILFYPTAMMSAPLDATALSVLMCAVGGALGALLFVAVSGFILRHRDVA
ncbi:hypothetical protein [Bifidobacterium choloepi]|uniref:Uncharacterized protein n=1 Tax=Bifidobacterium choloepi TaxID=2614131 RepID=A0A6I5MZU0_9BIFI|nr:hypothetical protein [Bifidobacterium choloepi]NEG69365.1 hypothetical protein [Bifidobacterium choloepi]